MLCLWLVLEGAAAFCDGVLKISGGRLVDDHSDDVVCDRWHVDSKCSCQSSSFGVYLYRNSLPGCRLHREALLAMLSGYVCRELPLPSPHHASSGHIADPNQARREGGYILNLKLHAKRYNVTYENYEAMVRINVETEHFDLRARRTVCTPAMQPLLHPFAIVLLRLVTPYCVRSVCF